MSRHATEPVRTNISESAFFWAYLNSALACSNMQDIKLRNPKDFRISQDGIGIGLDNVRT